MLKFEIKLNEPKGYDSLIYDDLYISDNLSYISCTTSDIYDLENNVNLLIEINNDGNLIEVESNVKTVTRKGYVIYPQKYLVEEYVHTYIPIENTKPDDDSISKVKQQNNNSTEQKTDYYYCLRYNDGKYYFSNKYNSRPVLTTKEECEKKENTCPIIKVGEKEYTVYKDSKDNLYTYVDTKCWIEDDVVKVDGVDYIVDIPMAFKTNVDNEGNVISQEYVALKQKNENNEDMPLLLTLNNEDKIEIHDCDKKDWKKIQKIELYKKRNNTITLEGVSYTEALYYFMYGKDENFQDKFYYFKYNEINKRYEISINNQIFYIDNSTNKVINASNPTEMYYKYEKEWVNSDEGEYINLLIDPKNEYLNHESAINIKLFNHDKKYYINVENNEEENINKYYIIYGNDKYYMANDTIDFMEINNKKCRIKYVDDNNWYIPNDAKNNTVYKFGYIHYDETDSEIPIIVINDNECRIYSQYELKLKNYNYKKYKFYKFNYFKIDNQNYLVNEKIDTDTSEQMVADFYKNGYVIINREEDFVYYVDEIVTRNIIRCHLKSTDKDCINYANHKIMANKNNLLINIIHPFIPQYNVQKESFIKYNNGYSEYRDKISILLYSEIKNIPLVTSNEIANNLRQEDIVQNKFIDKEVSNSINPYVDMEKEIYYPAYANYINGNNNTKVVEHFDNIDEIVFNLHFRTRDLTTWKIKEDITDESENTIQINGNWNFFDYYQNINKKKDETKLEYYNNDDYAYHQPSDLLCFLNFTNNDIFYHKSKVGKSFLRLLFFNSNNPYNQELLYTCTIFIDDGILYKKYVDCLINQNTQYIKIKDENNIKTILMNEISVDNDTCDKYGVVDFKEDNRLSASLSVKNRYLSNESSEGFYLYIFKEYCEKLHEEPIYMKIEFNHAGEGRTVNFTIPFSISQNDNGDDVYKLLNFNDNSDDVEEFKKGIPLNELHKHLYIPLESVYDFQRKCYVYYLPEWMKEEYSKDKSKMLFNLYEIKIKDESDINK